MPVNDHVLGDLVEFDRVVGLIVVERDHAHALVVLDDLLLLLEPDPVGVVEVHAVLLVQRKDQLGQLLHRRHVLPTGPLAGQRNAGLLGARGQGQVLLALRFGSQVGEQHGIADLRQRVDRFLRQQCEQRFSVQVERFQRPVRPGHHLRQERVRPYERLDGVPEDGLIVLIQRGEASDGWVQVGVDGGLLCGAPGQESGDGGFLLGRVDHRFRLNGVLQGVQDVRVGRRCQSSFEERLERVLDLLALIGKVEDQRVGLAGVGPVQLVEDRIALNELARATDDPLEVLRQVARESAEGQRRGEELLQEAEAKCISSAAPTPGASDLLMKAAQTDRRLAIVSNNGETAIRAYLESHRLGAFVSSVAGRIPTDASLMKPSAHLLDMALAELTCRPTEAVFVGDSDSDLHAAWAAGCPVIAFANRPEKQDVLMRHQPNILITSMQALAARLDTKDLMAGARQPEKG